jgi:hypothetical protein
MLEALQAHLNDGKLAKTFEVDDKRCCRSTASCAC